MKFSCFKLSIYTRCSCAFGSVKSYWKERMFERELVRKREYKCGKFGWNFKIYVAIGARMFRFEHWYLSIFKSITPPTRGMKLPAPEKFHEILLILEVDSHVVSIFLVAILETSSSVYRGQCVLELLLSFTTILSLQVLNKAPLVQL